MASRDAAALAAQVRLIVRVLRMDSLTVEQAAAYASKGARLESRPKPTAAGASRFMPVPKGVPHCTDAHCDCQPVFSQRWESDVDRFVDRQIDGVPLFLFRRVPALVFRLSRLEQWAIWLCVRQRLTYRAAAEYRLPNGKTLGIGKSQIGTLHNRALAKLARACWADDGTPVWG